MAKKKVILFAYDGTGLGHLMRLIKIASGFSKDVEALIVSGHNALSEVAQKNMNYFHLPNFYDERDKGKTNFEVNSYRMKILWNIINDYKPDAFVTDYLPLGKRCELYPIIAKYPTKKFFILRSEIGGEILAHQDVFSRRNLMFLDEKYTKIYVAGDKKIITPETYDWLPSTIKQKMEYAGCVTFKVTPNDIRETRQIYNPYEKKWIVCSVGGGRKGEHYIKKCISIASDFKYRDYIFDIVLGHYSPLDANIYIKSHNIPSNIRIHQSIKNLYLLNASADIVFCTGAYNSLIESMQGKKKTIISMSVMDDDIENEQTNNIINLSKFYDIKRVVNLEDLKIMFENALNTGTIKYDHTLNMNGVGYISNDIENQL